MTLVRAAIARLTPKTVLLELCGVAILAALAALWLQIPDAHAWQFALSLVFGLAILLGALLLGTTVLRWIRSARGREPLWRGMGLLALWLLLWDFLIGLVNLLNIHIVERAGLWNSRLSAHQRTLVTEQHLVVWQNDAISTLLWFILPSLFLPIILETVTRGLRSPWPAILRVYGRWQLWLGIALASFVGTWFVEKLTAWHQSESIRGELASVAFRLGTLYLLLIAVALITLAVVAELLARAQPTPLSEPTPGPEYPPEHR